MMEDFRIVVVGASAGGVEALTGLAAHLAPDLAAAVLIVIHFPAQSKSILPAILNRSGPLLTTHARSGEQIQPRRIYVAPPDCHLVLNGDRLSLNQGPRENGHRPAVDTLFRSAAWAYGNRVVGVVLSGTLDDGTAGLMVIHSQGGVTIAQDPQEAMFDGMPRSAIERAGVNYILPITGIAAYLNQLPPLPLVEEPPMPELDPHQERNRVAQDKFASERGERPGAASPFTCPDCGGVLWELQDEDLVRFRCHVGHSYSLDSLLAEQAEDVERALWSAVRALEEKAALARRMAAYAKRSNRQLSYQQFLERSREAASHAELVRQAILQQPPATRQGEALEGAERSPEDIQSKIEGNPL